MIPHYDIFERFRVDILIFMLRRHSNRRTRFDHAVLNQRQEGAASCDRIAGISHLAAIEVHAVGPRKADGSAEIPVPRRD